MLAGWHYVVLRHRSPMRTIRSILPAEMDGIYTQATAGPDIGHDYLRRIGI